MSILSDDKQPLIKAAHGPKTKLGLGSRVSILDTKTLHVVQTDALKSHPERFSCLTDHTTSPSDNARTSIQTESDLTDSSGLLTAPPAI